MADDYDYDAYKKKYGEPDQSKGQHLTDEFKKPNHITFSTDSVYHSKETPGGTWEKGTDSKWHYSPSDFVVKQHGPEKLQEYFKNNEPDAVLHLPETGKAFDKYKKIQESGPEDN